MTLVDISMPIDPQGWEPDTLEMNVLSPTAGGQHMVDALRSAFDIEFDISELPGGEFLSLDTLQLTTHTGTHIDAPSHYGSRPDGQRPLDIDEVPLEWFQGQGAVLDLTAVSDWVIGLDALQEAEAACPNPITPGTIVLLLTGAWKHAGTQRYFTDFIGLSGEATSYLLDKGVKVIGTDAFSLDSPFTTIIQKFHETNDPSLLWPAHVIGRDRPYSQIERLGDLSPLVGREFTITCFPVAIKGAGAGWTRAVASLTEE